MTRWLHAGWLGLVMACRTAGAGAGEGAEMKKPARVADVELEDLDALADAGEMRVTVTGTTEVTPFAETEAVAFEWVYGQRVDGRWVEYTVGYAHREPITVVTERGRITLRPGQFRTYLSATWERTFTPGDVGTAPEAIRDVLKESAEGLFVAEYALVPGRTYHARVHVDVFHLPPPGPDAPPRKGRRAVLWLSDVPFVEGRPVPAVTPSYQGWSY